MIVTDAPLEHALEVRRKVFVRECGLPALFGVPDEYDRTATHIVAYDSEPIACLRVNRPPLPQCRHFDYGEIDQYTLGAGMLAVVRGVRRSLLLEMFIKVEALVDRWDIQRIIAETDEFLVPMYRRMGFRTIGPANVMYNRIVLPIAADVEVMKPIFQRIKHERRRQSSGRREC